MPMTANEIQENRGNNNVNSQNICLQSIEVDENMGATIRQKLMFNQADHRVLLFKLFVVIPNVNDEDLNDADDDNIIFRNQGMMGWRYTGSRVNQNLEGYFNNVHNNGAERRFEAIQAEIDDKNLKTINLRFYYEIRNKKFE